MTSGHFQPETRRLGIYLLVALLLIALFGVSRQWHWQGSTQLHTLMESLATLLAAMVGTLALLRYYTRKSLTILLIGVGFLGTAFLDGYHAIVTSDYFAVHYPSPNESLIPWSWIASRLYLGFMLSISWLSWFLKLSIRVDRTRAEPWVLGLSMVLLWCSFFFFAFFPLPPAYYPEWIFHRPEEFVPALFFGVALVGYLFKGHWKHDAFEHWLILCLIVNFLSQALFMSLSGHLFDLEFDLAHLFKKLSYVLALVGLLYGIYEVYLREQQHAQWIQNQSSRQNLLLSSTAEGIFGLNREGMCTFCNPAALKMLGYNDDSEVVGQMMQELLQQDLAEEDNSAWRHARLIHAVQHGKRYQSVEDWFVRKDKTGFPVEINLSPIVLDGEIQGAVCVFSDITKRLQIESDHRTLVAAVEHFPVSVMVTNAKAEIEYVNPGTCEQSGYSFDELLGQNPRILQSGQTPSSSYEAMWAALMKGRDWQGIFHNRSKQGQLYIEEAWVAPVWNNHQKLTHFVSVAQDITERYEAEQALKQQAYHDALTGLANRTLFTEHLEHSMEMARLKQEKLIVLFIDLDGFKPVNDTYGHDVGDQLLIEIGRRIEQKIRRSDLAARLGGDEFTVLLYAGHNVEGTRDVVEKIHAAIQQPMHIEGHEISVSASIGVACYPTHGNNAKALFTAADIAMYEVKRRGRNDIAYAPGVLESEA